MYKNLSTKNCLHVSSDEFDCVLCPKNHQKSRIPPPNQLLIFDVSSAASSQKLIVVIAQTFIVISDESPRVVIIAQAFVDIIEKGDPCVASSLRSPKSRSVETVCRRQKIQLGSFSRTIKTMSTHLHPTKSAGNDFSSGTAKEKFVPTPPAKIPDLHRTSEMKIKASGTPSHQGAGSLENPALELRFTRDHIPPSIPKRTGNLTKIQQTRPLPNTQVRKARKPLRSSSRKEKMSTTVTRSTS